jgi:IclR family transcriptional regulator, acetate operon repressor
LTAGNAPAAVRTSKLQTADRALRILQAFAEPGQSLTVGELATRLSLHRSTASRLVSTLEARGFLQRNGSEALRLGPEVVRLGRMALGDRSLLDVARPIMDRLAEQTGETITLSVPAGDSVATIAQADGRHFVSSSAWVGVHAAPHCCSDGKVLLAFGAMALRPGRLLRYANNTVADRRVLETMLDDVRRERYATADSEMEDGLVGLSVPVFDAGKCVAALCISGPSYRLSAAKVRQFASLLQDAAVEIERERGGG